MSQPIPDYTEREQQIITTLLHERYGEHKELIAGDSEIRLSPSSPALTEAPMMLWEHEDCHFVIFKLDDGRYRSRFWQGGEPPGAAGVQEHDDLGECVTGVLRVQADHENP